MSPQLDMQFMEQLDPALKDAIEARHEGRNADALRLLVKLFGQGCRSDTHARASHFLTMFEWNQLAEDYPPAREAMASARDEQVGLLLGGDENFSTGADGWPRSRFQVIVHMNETLKDAGATYALFIQLQSLMPALARRKAFLALPAIVEAGDYALAERYLPDPLAQLADLNALSSELPLFPPDLAAPRLAAELSNFMKDVRLRAATLQGLGRVTEAEALREAALAGISSDEMRALAQREIAEPGTIMCEATDHRIALKATGPLPQR